MEFSSSKNHQAGWAASLEAIAARFGTPLFLYDQNVLKRNWLGLRETYPPEFSISYSVKANPNPAIVKFFVAQGSGLEIASAGEFFIALKAGGAAENILFAGPGKTAAELEYVLSQGIGEIHAESLVEVERIGAICRKLGATARIALRINPREEAQGGAMRMGGKPVAFGIDEERLDEAIDKVLADATLEFRGIHLFSGTQILDHAVLIRQYRKGLEIALRTARRLGRPLHTLDFGGGLGIPYFASEKPLDMAALRLELAGLVGEIRQERLFDGTKFVLEPGRFLVGEAGVYVARITDIKISRGKKFLIVDGGMNHHLAASGNLGQVIKRNFPVTIVNKTGVANAAKVDVVGPLCTPLDMLARDIELPQAEIGDLIAVHQSGAYGRTSSPLGFLSHPSPPEVMLRDGQAELIRRRGTYEDMLSDIPAGL